MAGDDASIIAAVEAGEDHVKEVYQKVVLDTELSDPIRIAVESEFAQIKATHDEKHEPKPQRVNGNYQTAVESIRTHPVGAIFGAAAVGFIFGRALQPRSEKQLRQRLPA